MVKSLRKTRKARSLKKSVLTIPQLRKSFDHMDKVVEGLRKMSKHSFSDAVVKYREEWSKTFKRDLSPADAAAYLKFRFGLKSNKTRRSKLRGGAILAGAPLDYQLRPGASGVYGNFPSYQQEGLDRYYGSAISADCGKPNGFPTDGSGASQAGGGWADGLFRPIMTSNPAGLAYQTQMVDIKGTTPFPTADPVGQPPYRPMSASYITGANLNSHIRSYGTDMYRTSATTPTTGVVVTAGTPM